MNNNSTVKAILLHDITYLHGESEIRIPQGTLILVDIGESIALIGSDHVHIDRHEFSVIERQKIYIN